MKILHVCLASHYTEGMTYQDNLLPEQNAIDGNEVIVVSDCYVFEAGKLVKVNEEDRVLPSGVRLVRFDYDDFFGEVISSKVRKVARLYPFLNRERPDVILFHGVAGWEMLSVAKYKRNNAGTKLFIDSHEDVHNSGTFFLSRFLQYQIFNRLIVKRIRKYVDKFLYISLESKEFLRNMYSLKDCEMEFFPLGGVVIDRQKRAESYKVVRDKHQLSENDILIVHSGKLSREKRTEELIEAFTAFGSPYIKLLIAGSIPDDQKKTLNPLIEGNENIIFLGWISSEDLVTYLAAADLYFQPGTQSATMQIALCCGAAVALYPYDSHQPYIKGNGFYVKDEKDIIDVLMKITKNPEKLIAMSDASFEIAENLLCYKRLAARLYN